MIDRLFTSSGAEMALRILAPEARVRLLVRTELPLAYRTGTVPACGLAMLETEQAAQLVRTLLNEQLEMQGARVRMRLPDRRTGVAWLY